MSHKSFKLWSSDRNKKICIFCIPQLDIILSKAKEIFHIDIPLENLKIVLESDGTEIYDDGSLDFFSNQTLMILTDCQKWSPPHSENVPYYVSSVEDPSSYASLLEASLSTSHCSSPSTSRSMSSPFGTSSNEMHVLAEGCKDSFANFSIPWNKVPPHIQIIFNEKKKLCLEMSTFVNFLINEMRAVSLQINKRYISIVARKCMAKYLSTFEDRDDDNILISSQPTNLITRLINRNAYVNRTPNRPKSLRDITRPTMNKRIRSIGTKSGCSNWQPDSIPEEESEESISEKMLWLKTYSKELNVFQNTDKIKDYMTATYAHQRAFLNSSENTPTVEEIEMKMGFIFIQPYLSIHFEMLINCDIHNLINNFIKKQQKIISSGNKSNRKDIIQYFAATTIKSTENICLGFLPIYLKEKSEFLFTEFKIGTNISQVDPTTSSPWIAILDTGTSNIYYIFIEKKVVNSTATSLTEAVCFMIMFFHIFNMEYPKEISDTLEFLQKYFLKINPETGSRSQKKKARSTSKVVLLISKISEYEENSE